MRLQLADLREGPEDECGVVGVFTPHQLIAPRRAFWALQALQHRGQEAAGISSWKQDHLETHRDLGLVAYVFKDQDLERLSSDMAIGHVRYSTTGASNKCNAQPVYYKAAREVVVAHNGNLVNAGILRRELMEEGYKFVTTSDSEVIAALIASRGNSPKEGLKEAMRLMQGAYSLVVLSEGQLLAARDAHGIRPLVLGMQDRGYIIASETCALDLLEAEYLRDVVAGEMLVVTSEGLSIEQVHTPTPHPCSFEAIYFARPDSKLGSETVYDIRLRLGRELAKEYPLDADAVIGVPDSGHTMAVGYAQEAGIPFEDGFIKNRYVNRTFIEPTDEERQIALRKKFNPMPSVVTGKRLVVVDDSLIRGNTTRHIIRMLRQAGADEVHMRIASPPTRHPCHYGIDMGKEGDYIATDSNGERRSAEEIGELLGADSLHYLTPQGLARAFKRPLTKRCTACFTGNYPIEPVEGGKNLLEEIENSGVGDPECVSS